MRGIFTAGPKLLIGEMGGGDPARIGTFLCRNVLWLLQFGRVATLFQRLVKGQVDRLADEDAVLEG